MNHIVQKAGFVVGFFALVSCQIIYQPKTVQYKDYRLTQNSKQDTSIQNLLKPFSDSVNKNMNDIIAVAATELVKKQPEGTLGNVLADAMLMIGREKYHQKVDASFINSGGIRLTALAAGNITRGKIFELAPFDNIIVLLKVNGTLLQELLNHISARGGWPVAGIKWQIQNKTAVNVIIAGQPLSASANYTIALLDYIANGGDDCDMLKPVPQINNGTLFRDAVIQYFGKEHKEGRKINSEIEKRISHAE